MTAVIFDCDGVLVDSEPVANRVLAEGLTAIGLPTSTDDSVREFMGRSWGHMVEVVTERLGAPPPATLRDDYRAALFAAYAAGEAPAIPGIAEALDGLDAAAIPYCLASSGDHERIRRGLAAAGLTDRFPDARIFSADDVGRGKPWPDLFHHAAERMGFEPAATVVVEDSPAGVKAGRAAGMRVLGYSARTPAALLRDEGAEPFDAMAELPRLVSASRR
ncbi:HAD family phosphatase [Conexibacter sp. JD483]|uniref:HAD family hydrolase n=1 Tax=unclassified Conexibacter TaxID=2627773 RepID=UPI0027275C24|nr:MULTISPECIES: HAD family phosphatase [unclassified Conexibacter]MDO8184024.1 HAD family phosphatase [Conexibacter sp. CPCC 205706]MDO8197016.1 HAD family phosphatase [Conexibacter sp. CPCC 205762]MDR9367932.1 HAD family phosphatase [Conexibacter sp. JD483]